MIDVEPRVMRIRSETVSFTRMERFKVWFWRVWFAMTEEVPHSYNRDVEVKPGEPGYEDAYEVMISTLLSEKCFNYVKEDEDAGT